MQVKLQVLYILEAKILINAIYYGRILASSKILLYQGFACGTQLTNRVVDVGRILNPCYASFHSTFVAIVLSKQSLRLLSQWIQQFALNKPEHFTFSLGLILLLKTELSIEINLESHLTTFNES